MQYTALAVELVGVGALAAPAGWPVMGFGAVACLRAHGIGSLVRYVTGQAGSERSEPTA